MYRKALIIIIFKIILVYGAEHDLFCDERFTVISDLEDSDCDPYHLVPDLPGSNCVRVCKKAAAHNNDCDEDPCPPGFKCVIDVKDPEFSSCHMDLDSCFKYYTNYSSNNENTDYKDAYWKPECLKNGEWAPKQCKGEVANGRCFCYDDVGKRIFGQQFSTKAENMTCACSRHKVKMETDPNNWYVSLHCDIEGNYEPLQCNIMDEMCWCAEPQTGEVVSQIVPMDLWTYLPCYDTSINGEFYMRQCESHLFAQKKLDRTLKTHGTMNANYPHVMCDPDGSYGTYTITNGQASCVWRDKSPIAPYGAEADFDKMDCNCARDTKLLASQELKCTGNGSYQKAQKIGTEFYCVDSDGYQNLANTVEMESDCNINTRTINEI